MTKIKNMYMITNNNNNITFFYSLFLKLHWAQWTLQCKRKTTTKRTNKPMQYILYIIYIYIYIIHIYIYNFIT